MIIIGYLGKLQIEILRKGNSYGEGEYIVHLFESTVKVNVPGFTAEVETQFSLNELQDLEDQLIKLTSFQVKTIDFTPENCRIHFIIHLTETGSVDVVGIIGHDLYNHLNFQFTSDLATLDRLLIDLKIVINSFK